MDAKFQFCETQMGRTVGHNLVWKHGNVLQWRVNFITHIILEAKLRVIKLVITILCILHLVTLCTTLTDCFS